jgi:hypothetical protein
MVIVIVLAAIAALFEKLNKQYHNAMKEINGTIGQPFPRRHY